MVGAAAESVGALGVIGSLFYLATQIGQNTRSVRRAAYQELLNHIAQLNTLLVTDRELAELFVRARQGLDGFDEADRIRVLAWFGTVFRHYQNAFLQHEEGILSDVQWQGLSAPIPRLLSDAGGRAMWGTVASSYRPEFRDFVEARVAEASVDR